jgi:hypothetical protein
VRVMQQMEQVADKVGHSARVVVCLRCARQCVIVGSAADARAKHSAEHSPHTTQASPSLASSRHR